MREPGESGTDDRNADRISRDRIVIAQQSREKGLTVRKQVSTTFDALSESEESRSDVSVELASPMQKCKF
jgi:hypothetical protein